REGSIFLRLRLADRRIRQPDLQGHHRSDQGGSCGDPERSVRRGSPDHHGSHGGRSAEEERRRWRHASGQRHGWHGWYGFLSPTVQRSKKKKGPAAMPGLSAFSCAFVIAVALLNLPQAVILTSI